MSQTPAQQCTAGASNRLHHCFSKLKCTHVSGESCYNAASGSGSSERGRELCVSNKLYGDVFAAGHRGRSLARHSPGGPLDFHGHTCCEMLIYIMWIRKQFIALKTELWNLGLFFSPAK